MPTWRSYKKQYSRHVLRNHYASQGNVIWNDILPHCRKISKNITYYRIPHPVKDETSGQECEIKIVKTVKK